MFKNANKFDRDISKWKFNSNIVTVICHNTSGVFVNNGDCMCGASDCTASTGLFCQSSLNKCVTMPLCFTGGTVENEAACTCGTRDCTPTTGLYCKSDFCSTFAIGSAPLPNGDSSKSYIGTGLRKVVSDFEQGSGSLYDAVISQYGPIHLWNVSEVTNLAYGTCTLHGECLCSVDR